MKLSNSDFINFKNKIKFDNNDKKRFQDQIDNLVYRLTKEISEHKIDTRVIKVLQAGSWKKGTIIKPDTENPVDIDLIFYLDIDSNELVKLQSANSILLPLLKKIYPMKSESDFWQSKKTAGLEFVDSGLNVDVVPVGKTSNPNYVAQPDKDFKFYYTAPQLQLDFISQRKEENANFKTIVRILKKWRNQQELQLSSFSIELIVSYLDIKKGIETNIYEALMRFFTFLSKKANLAIFFDPEISHMYKSIEAYIADPTNRENNVVTNMTELDWLVVKQKANNALEILVHAEDEESLAKTIEYYKQVFGSSFNTEE